MCFVRQLLVPLALLSCWTLVFTCYFICTTCTCLCSQINDDDDILILAVFGLNATLIFSVIMICAFDCYQNRWPGFYATSHFWEATTAKRMKIDPYYQRQKCKAFVDIRGGFSGLGRQMAVKLSTTAIVCDLGGYFFGNVRDKASQQSRYATSLNSTQLNSNQVYWKTVAGWLKEIQ